MKASKSSLDGYIKLAKAVLSRGKQEHDTSFLNSDWAEYLRENVADYERDATNTCNLYAIHHFDTGSNR